jgi:hypothetical protein
MVQQFAQGAGEIAETYQEKLQTLNADITQPQLTTKEVTGIGSFATQQTVTSLGTQFEEMGVSATSRGGIARISNPVQQAAQGMDTGVVNQQSPADDRLEQVRQRLDQVSAESVAANETGMGAGLAAETAGSEALAALL